jgi:G3E family GTPase
MLLNKIDLVDAKDVEPLETKLREINPAAAIVRTERCRIDPELLFGIGREKKIAWPRHEHQPEFESFTFSSDKTFSRKCFERFADGLSPSVLRAKGFVRFAGGAQLFNFVAGRWDLEPFETDRTELVFIGKNLSAEKSEILRALNDSQVK